MMRCTVLSSGPPGGLRSRPAIGIDRSGGLHRITGGLAVGKTDGDISAEFAEYAVRARSRLQRTAYLMCGDWHLADDLTQETLITLYRRWGALDPDIGPAAYATRILVNKVRRSAKRAWRSREIMTPPPDLPAPTSQGTENREVIVKALSRLGPRQRAIA